MNKFVWLILVVIVIGFSWYIWGSFTKPLSGESVPDLGREHINDITRIEYNSNPPTSGNHFPVWAKKGVYDRVLSDGYLIHSLEHGYIVVSYNCESKRVKGQESRSNFVNLLTYTLTLFKPYTLTYAHTGEEEASSSSEASSSATPLHKMLVGEPFTPENPPVVEVELSESFKSDECKQLASWVGELTRVADRIIVVPRPTLDARIALTAWTRLIKMDSFDRGKAEQFIKDFHNRGPEKTME